MGNKIAGTRWPGTALWSAPAVIVGACVFVIATVIGIVAGWRGIELELLVRDPAASYKYPPYVGFFSHIGIVVMVSTASLTAFAAWMSIALGRGNTRVLANVSVLSAVLAIDDIFMIHEQASRLGEVAIFAVYGLLALAIWRYLHRSSDRYDLRGLAAAIALLGFSVFVDVFRLHGPIAYWLEDFSKLSGFAAWLTFWAGYAHHTLNEA